MSSSMPNAYCASPTTTVAFQKWISGTIFVCSTITVARAAAGPRGTTSSSNTSIAVSAPHVSVTSCASVKVSLVTGAQPSGPPVEPAPPVDAAVSVVALAALVVGSAIPVVPVFVVVDSDVVPDPGALVVGRPVVAAMGPVVPVVVVDADVAAVSSPTPVAQAVANARTMAIARCKPPSSHDLAAAVTPMMEEDYDGPILFEATAAAQLLAATVAATVAVHAGGTGSSARTKQSPPAAWRSSWAARLPG